MDLFDIFFDVATESWQNWKAVFFYAADQKTKSKDLNRGLMTTMVKTQDFCRIEFFMQRLFHAKHPVMIIGPTGTGKTTLLRHYLRTHDNTNKMTHLEIISCSLAATASKTQTFIESNMNITRTMMCPH